MWLGIIALLDKVFSVLGVALGWWKESSDDSKKKREAAQKDMDAAERIGDFDAWKRARHARNRA